MQVVSHQTAPALERQQAAGQRNIVLAIDTDAEGTTYVHVLAQAHQASPTASAK